METLAATWRPAAHFRWKCLNNAFNQWLMFSPPAATNDDWRSAGWTALKNNKQKKHCICCYNRYVTNCFGQAEIATIQNGFDERCLRFVWPFSCGGKQYNPYIRCCHPVATGRQVNKYEDKATVMKCIFLLSPRGHVRRPNVWNSPKISLKKKIRAGNIQYHCSDIWVHVN